MNDSGHPFGLEEKIMASEIVLQTDYSKEISVNHFKFCTNRQIETKQKHIVTRSSKLTE